MSDTSTQEMIGVFVKRFLDMVLLHVSAEIEQKIEVKFFELGITSPEDLHYVEDEDFNQILSPIQVRKVRCWKENLNKSASSSNSSVSSPIVPEVPPTSPVSGSSSTSFDKSWDTSLDSSLDSGFNRNAEWAETVPLPYAKLIPAPVLTNLSKGSISSESRRKLVRSIVDEIRKHSKHVTCSQFRIIAKRIVEKYSALKDHICGNVIGTGYDSLFNQLVSRNDNCNRGQSPFCKRKIPVSKSCNDTKSLSKQDAYGCIQFSPDIDDLEEGEDVRNEMISMKTKDVINWREIENKLKMTYPLQRKEINLQSFSTGELLERWPFLFKEEGLLLHFKLLTGIDALEILYKFIEERGKQISLYFNSSSQSILETSINGVIKKFKEEKDDLLFFTDSMSIVKEVEKINKKETPIIAVLGSSISEAKEFMILVDRIVVCTTSTLNTAFLCYFSLFYVLNIKYTISLEGTLEFFQRCMMGLNPQSGSKSKKPRKSCVNSKVLKMIAEISSNDWIGSSE